MKKTNSFIFFLSLILVNSVNAQTVNVRAALSIDGNIECNWARDRIITTISGPCEKFQPPRQVAIGEPFSANDKNLRINIIRATKYTSDTAKMNGANPNLWYCVAADNERDLPKADSRGLKGTWLYIKNCQPIS